MGLDYLDMIFRLEKRFKFKLQQEDLGITRALKREHFGQQDHIIVTAGEIAEAVATRIEYMKKLAIARQLPYPPEWDMSLEAIWICVREDLAKVAGKSAEMVLRESRLVEDLGLT